MTSTLLTPLLESYRQTNGHDRNYIPRRMAVDQKLMRDVLKQNATSRCSLSHVDVPLPKARISLFHARSKIIEDTPPQRCLMQGAHRCPKRLFFGRRPKGTSVFDPVGVFASSDSKQVSVSTASFM